MSIRVRLAAWCVSIFTVLLIGLTLVIYVVHARAQYRDLDSTLAAITSHYQSELDRQLANGVPLTANLVTAIDSDGQELIGAQLAVYDAAGWLVFGRAVPSAEPTLAPAAFSPHGPGTFRTIDTPEGRMRVHSMPLSDSARTVGYVQSAVSLDRSNRTIARFRLLLIITVAAGLVVATVGSLVTAGRALRPLAEITETARAIALSHGFGRRLDLIRQNDELGELARTFNEMLASLEEAYQAQRRFVDNAAHELRVPLTSIIGNLELLDRAQDLPAAEQSEVIADVRAEAGRLGRMVNELLTLARADAGLRLARQPVDMDRLVVDVLRQAGPLAYDVYLSIAPLAPVSVEGDADRLRQLLMILIENALHYTPPGGKVTVALRARGGEAQLTVADTGVGIAPEDLPRIFDRFYRADPARARAASGSGLGLAIAKWIAESHDGRIEVESQPGTGSTFIVTLPVAHVRRPQASPETVPQPRG